MAIRTTARRPSEEVEDPPGATADDGEGVLNSVSNAMRDAAQTASAHAARMKQSVSGAGPTAMASISRAVYTGAYVLAYGAVYAAVFVAQSMPQENPIAHGLRDGGRAAMDALDARSATGEESDPGEAAPAV
jgi:hypothetical protein